MRDIKYICMSIVAIMCTRPNLLGEYVGIVSPIFWMGLIYLTRLKGSQKKIVAKIKISGATGVYTLFIAYWMLSFITSQYNNLEFKYWPAIANLGTLVFVLTSITHQASHGRLEKFLLIFAFLNSYLGISGLISKYLLFSFGCQNFYLDRVWEYRICAPGAIFVGNRLTGIGGEPAIFASYCILSIAIFQLASINPSTKFLGILGCSSGVILTASSTGYALLPISILLFKFFLKGNSIKRTVNGYILLVSVFFSYSLLIKTTETYFRNKKFSNSFSVSDRGLDVPLFEYFKSWGKGFFYDGSPFNESFSTISVLRESLSQGVWVILLFLLILFCLAFISKNSFRYFIAVLPISFTIFIAEPFWSNAFWITILLCVSFYFQKKTFLDQQ